MESGRWPHLASPMGDRGALLLAKEMYNAAKSHFPWGQGLGGCFTRVVPLFLFPFDLFPLFFILPEGLQHQGLCWSRQRNCLNNPGFDLFLFSLVFI